MIKHALVCLLTAISIGGWIGYGAWCWFDDIMVSREKRKKQKQATREEEPK